MFNPYITHPLTAALRVLIGWVLLKALMLFGIVVPYPELFAMAYGMGFYEGREAGQREHDIKNMSLDKSKWAQFVAFLKAEYWFGWTVSNGLQALVGTVGAVIAALLIHFLVP